MRELDVSLASRGDMRCLLPCFYSVLIQKNVRSVSIYMTGEFPSFGDFYLEQLSALADLLGIQLTLVRAGRLTVRQVRDKMLRDGAESGKSVLWMIDDDVVLHPTASEGVAVVVKMLHDSGGWEHTAAITGLKPDVNNRRGYPDFEAKELPLSEFAHGSYNCLYPVSPVMVKTCYTCDTGNLVLNLRSVWENPEIRFQTFKESANSGGEDTLFAMLCSREGLDLWKSNGFLAYHLEKDAKPFSEFAARKEMLLRASDVLGAMNVAEKANWKKEFMPFVKTEERD